MLEAFVEMVASRVAEKLRPMLAETSAPSPSPLLSKCEVASALRVHPATIDRLVRAGRIPFVRVGDVKRFDLELVRLALSEKPARAEDRPPIEVQGPLFGVHRLSRGGIKK
jgi:excisionase family DNA binding protein